MSTETLLVRTMSDTVETDIHRVLTIANELLPRYDRAPLSFEQLRKIADGPFDLFLIPLIFSKEFAIDRNLPFNEAKRVEIRRQALEIARKHGFDMNPPGFIPGIEESLRETKDAGLRNVLMTTGGRRYKHQAMEKAGIGGYFDEIVDRDLRIILLTGTATYIRAGNNADGCKVGNTELEVVTVALSTAHAYNDEETLGAAGPKMLIHRYDELLPSLAGMNLLAA